jgi:IS1 family transposase
MCLFFTDFWRAYQGPVPDTQHRACGKQEGQSDYVERFNLTLDSASGDSPEKHPFSKSQLMQLIHIRSFLGTYNLERTRKPQINITNQT